MAYPAFEGGVDAVSTCLAQRACYCFIGTAEADGAVYRLRHSPEESLECHTVNVWVPQGRVGQKRGAVLSRGAVGKDIGVL